MNNIIISAKDYTEGYACNYDIPEQNPDYTNNHEIWNRDSFVRNFLKDLQNQIDKGKVPIWYADRVSGLPRPKFRVTDPFSIGEKTRFGNLVGVYRTKAYQPTSKRPESNADSPVYDIELQIRCRFDKDEKRPYFLLHMLSSLCDLELNDSQVHSSPEDIFRILMISRFRNQLTEANRNGNYRTYQTFRQNNENVRGSIDVEQHLQLNMGLHQGKIACVYRKLTVDNSFNHLVLHTYEFIKRHYRDSLDSFFSANTEAGRILRQLSVQAPSWQQESPDTVIRKNQKAISAPYYLPYEKLRITCLAILRSMGFSVFGDTPDEVNGFLVYIPDLWEKYLENLLQKKLGDNYRVEPQKETGIYGPNFYTQTYPDFVISKDRQYIAILDAKFKKGWDKKSDKLDYRSDSPDDSQSGDPEKNRFLDDYNKCIRDMVSYSCHKTGVIYPQLVSGNGSFLPNGAGKSETPGGHIYPHAISRYNSADMFYRCALLIPQMTGDWASWERQMTANETDFIERLKNECLSV